MKNEKIPVLVLTDVVIFPNNEVRIEYDDTFDKKIIDLIDDSFDKLMIIVNPIDDHETGDITNLPKYGVLGQLKLKINVPNGKTRVVIEGIKRISVGNYDFNNGVYEANFTDIKISDSDDKNYFNILIKSLERYISKVPYMSNAIMSQLNSVNDLTNLCDLIASFLPVSYEKKKKYIYTTNDIERAKLLIKDMNEDLKFIELEREIESEVEKEIDESQREFF